MKYFIRKSFVVALISSPLLSHALDCGPHTVLNLHQGGDWGAILFAVKSMDRSVTKYARPDMNIFNTTDKIRTLTTLVLNAKLTESPLRVIVADGGSCSAGEYFVTGVNLE